MKALKIVSFLAATAVLPCAYAQKGTLQFPTPPPSTPPPSPPPVVVAEPAPPPIAEMEQTQGEVYVYDQKPVSVPAALVTPEQAQAIIDRFKAAYEKLGSPRFLIYVNRDLVNEQSGLKLTGRKERVERSRTGEGSTAATAVKSVENNTYSPDGQAQPTLADKQTVRDVERLFGRPLREAGATLADQRVAAELVADKPLGELIGTTDTPQARKDREALGKVADAVIEVLISSRTITVPTISGSQSLAIPDIQATAIRLKDSRILGQASSTDVTSRVPQATLGNFGVEQVTEATALALMDDMTPRP